METKLSKIYAISMVNKESDLSSPDMDIAKITAGLSFAFATALTPHFQQQLIQSQHRVCLLILGFAVSFFTSLAASLLNRVNSLDTVAKIVEKLGTGCVVVTFFGMIASMLPTNLMLVAVPFCLFVLGSIALGIFKSK